MSKQRETDRTAEPSNKARAQEQAEWEKSNENVVDSDHTVVEPTEADYEKARTVGIGDEPELPPGKVENGGVARAQAATDAQSEQAVSRARTAAQPTSKS